MSAVSGFVRWPTPADTWATRHAKPKGYRIAIVDEFAHADSRWRRLHRARTCRWMENRVVCKRPAVVELRRGSALPPWDGRIWWAYCERHLYGRRWEDGRLLTTTLVEDTP